MRFIRRGDYHRYDLLSEEEPEEAPDGRVRTDEGGQVLRCCADCGAPFFRFPDGEIRTEHGCHFETCMVCR